MNTEKHSTATPKAAQIRAKIDALKREVRTIEARQTRKAKTIADREHCRRAFMVGELFVVGAEKNPELKALITGMVASVYTSPADRALWGLAPVQTTQAAADQPVAGIDANPCIPGHQARLNPRLGAL